MDTILIEDTYSFNTIRTHRSYNTNSTLNASETKGI